MHKKRKHVYPSSVGYTDCCIYVVPIVNFMGGGGCGGITHFAIDELSAAGVVNDWPRTAMHFE